MLMRLKFKKYLIALVCVVFVAAACSDDDDSNNGGTGGTLTDAASDADQTGDGTSQTDGDNNSDAGSDAEQDTEPDPECGEGQAYCDNACVDTLESTEHCGGCGNTCPSWNATCDQGTCLCNTDDLTYCENDGFCVDTKLDPSNCGVCGNVCSSIEVCDEGACKTRPELVTEWTNTARSTPTNCGAEGQFPAAAPLQLDTELSKAAQAHAEDMRDNDFLDHTGSDDSDFVMRIERTNYQGQPLGENIAAGYNTSQEVVEGWVGSDGHCAGLMNSDATRIGVGYADEEEPGPDDMRTYWVQVFGN
jgi:hypothetical protein